MDDEAQINTGIISELRLTIQALETEKDFLKEQQDESKKRMEELLYVNVKFEFDDGTTPAAKPVDNSESRSDLKRSTALREELERNHARTQLVSYLLGDCPAQGEFRYETIASMAEHAMSHDDLTQHVETCQFRLFRNISVMLWYSIVQSDNNTAFNLLENLKNKCLSNSMQITGMTICHTFRNIGRYIEWGMLSDPQYMRGLLWHIQLRPVQSGTYLGIYLYCSPPDPSDGWSCRAKHKTTLYANNAADDVLFREGIYKTYSSETPNWGRNHYVYWTELLTKYVKDDSITVKMEIWIEQPQGV